MPEMSYMLNGDYLIPEMMNESLEAKPLGKYGRMRKAYLAAHRPILFNRLLLNGTLNAHLTEIDETAQRRLEQMMSELAEANGVTESLKASDPMKWVGLMNALKAQAEEILLTELVYS